MHIQVSIVPQYARRIVEAGTGVQIHARLQPEQTKSIPIRRQGSRNQRLETAGANGSRVERCVWRHKRCPWRSIVQPRPRAVGFNQSIGDAIVLSAVIADTQLGACRIDRDRRVPGPAGPAAASRTILNLALNSFKSTDSIKFALLPAGTHFLPTRTSSRFVGSASAILAGPVSLAVNSSVAYSPQLVKRLLHIAFVAVGVSLLPRPGFGQVVHPSPDPAPRHVATAPAMSPAMASAAAGVTPAPRAIRIGSGGVVEAGCGGAQGKLRPGDRLGDWTLMAVLRPGKQRPIAVFEDYSSPNGRILFADEEGSRTDFTKSLEPTFAEPASLYHGHSLQEVLNSDRDLLGEELLGKPGDPDYAEVAACFPPISKMRVYTFLGTHDCFEKVGIFYGGSTPNFDPAAYVPAIEKIRDEGRVCDGLVGGSLPALRFVYPEKPGDWSELVAYAPMRVENGNNRVQPVWYRVSRIESNTLRWVRYFDSYHGFPPRTEQRPERFYEELLAMRAGWERALQPGMKIEIPDQHLSDLAQHSLVRDMITRIGAFPKYGVFERGYGGSEHDGFLDTLNADAAAMLEWGLFDLAGQYLDNYLTFFVRDDGSILYRGPETGQLGRMLTIVAQYANYTRDARLLLKHRRRLDAVARLLLDLRGEALALPPDDPAYGMIAGWSEADSCLDPDPPRYMQPYLSNSTEAERGFRDLGAVWERVGRAKRQPELAAWGLRLRQEASAIASDLQNAIARSMLTNTQPPCLPAIAGVKEPFDVALKADTLDPQFRSYRAYAEMLHSGNLTRDQVKTIVEYRAAHRDTILGIPTCYGYNTHEMAGFLSYGHAFGLLQHDFVREYLLTLYSLAAHHYTRGTWTAPETRRLDPKEFAAPYCTPAQMTAPLLVRWMLVFEDPASNVLWLSKGTPRSWLEDGKRIAVSNAPTRWGRLSFSIESHLREGNVQVSMELPPRPKTAQIKLRLRVPEGNRIQSATVDGNDWLEFDATEETVTLPSQAKGHTAMLVRYQNRSANR